MAEIFRPTEPLKNWVNHLPRLHPGDEEKMLSAYFDTSFWRLNEARHKARGCTSFPPVIEVTGMPAAGKTSLIKYVSDFMKSNDIPHRIVEEKTVPFDKEEVGSYNRTTYQALLTSETAKDLSDLYLNHKGEGPIFLDRGIYNIIPFLDADNKGGKDHAIENYHEIAKRYFDDNFGGMLDSLIIVRATPKESLERSGGIGRVRNIEYLRLLFEAFENLPEEVCRLRNISKHHDIVLTTAIIDTTRPLEESKDLMLRTVGSICYFHAQVAGVIRSHG